MHRLDLTTPTTGQKIVMVLLFLPIAVVTLCLGTAFVGIGEPVFVMVFAGCMVPIVLLLGYLVLSVLRSRTWLEETVLVVRHAFTTRRCDLSTARVRIGTRQMRSTVSTGEAVYQVPAGRMPVLQAQRPGTRTWLTVGLRDAHGNLLDPAKLNALVAAITAGPRPEPDRSHAVWAADGIRQLASNPVHRLL